VTPSLLRRDPFTRPEELIQRVYAYVAYRIGDGPDAEDVTSEVFERALRYRDRYDPSRGEPVAWLLGIARRRVNGALAASRPLAAERRDEPAPGTLEETTVRRLMIAEALNKLADRDRELIALRYGADLTAAQIAGIVGARTNAIEVALHRALSRLRAELEDAENATTASRPVRS
jgi:RNA polymerase sigma factor (sigma-70 family)